LFVVFWFIVYTVCSLSIHDVQYTVLGALWQACLFVMLSPDESNLSETMSTLQFGSNAQQVALGQAKKNITKGPPVAN